MWEDITQTLKMDWSYFMLNPTFRKLIIIPSNVCYLIPQRIAFRALLYHDAAPRNLFVFKDMTIFIPETKKR